MVIVKRKNWIVIILSSIYFLIILSTLYVAIFGDLSAVVGKELPPWYDFFIYATAVIYFVGFIFILRMKRAALISLTAITVVLHIFSFVINTYSLVSLTMDVIIFGLLWTQFKKMT
jgi:hypothetical protein